ncbi:unnamed protein product [Commensalibacter communis]|uniref:Knr4/Smi1-like domain-containing protein n=1 Tax=Commensalibacter communis TaxID=2972786 RepID=A0A9W4TQR4_9PROT|nr:SMI1/KNR4 family protein [Commensalibacter communis]CAI3949152.1 unnamed protein product [Commensalibacter communis]CAI3950724.1 unnamed protein product [Commensalibacter communis]CAI3952273.1 unnamed protein product [Commensalibacter communis]CAI3953396.1 unnamed protein product [Commensalibacter communis]
MMNTKITQHLLTIELQFDIQFPTLYKQFLVEIIQDQANYEIMDINQNYVSLYSYSDLIERNETYQIQEYEPDYLLIGQNGDQGYFIYVKPNHASEVIYINDLGALGSLEMQPIAPTINDLAMP